jgi:hypothetical protein
MRRTVLLAALLAATAAPHAGAKPPPTTYCTRITLYADSRAVVVSQYDADGNPGNGGQCGGPPPAGAVTWAEFAPLAIPEGDICLATDDGQTIICIPWGWPPIR